MANRSATRLPEAAGRDPLPQRRDLQQPTALGDEWGNPHLPAEMGRRFLCCQVSKSGAVPAETLGTAKGLLLCFLFQIPPRLGRVWPSTRRGTQDTWHGVRWLPGRGAPRGLSNLRMVKHKGQSQVRQPMRRLLQSGTGSTGPHQPPPAAPSTRHVVGSSRAPGLCLQPFNPTRVTPGTAPRGDGEGARWVPVPKERREESGPQLLRRSCWKLEALVLEPSRSAKPRLPRESCCSRDGRLWVL